MLEADLLIIDDFKNVLLDTKALVVGSAEHTHTLLFCEDTNEFYALVPTLNLFTILSLSIHVAQNEEELGSAKMRQSINIVINEAVKTNSKTASEAYKIASAKMKFRRLR